MLFLAFLLGAIFGAIFVAAVEVHVLTKVIERATASLPDRTSERVDGRDPQHPLKADSGITTALYTVAEPLEGVREAATAPSAPPPPPTPQPPEVRAIPAFLMRNRCSFCSQVRKNVRKLLNFSGDFR